MKNYLDLLTNSKKIYYLDIFVLLSFFSILAGTAFLNFFSTFTSILFLFLIFKKKDNFLSKNKKLLIFLFLILIINIIFSTLPFNSFVRSLGITKLIFFSLALIYLLDKNEYFNQILAKFIILIITIIILSMSYQFLNGSLFGHGYVTNHGNSLSGVFGDEYIAGSVLSKMYLLALPFFFNVKKKNLIIFLYFILVFFFIILSNQRSPIIMTLLSLICYYLFTYEINFKKKFFGIFLIVTILFSSLAFNEGFHDKFIKKTNNQLFSSPEKSLASNLKDTMWGAHFLTAYEIYKDNKFFGSGAKTFRIKCADVKYELIESDNKDLRCSSHPHNIYLEILSEFGLIVFISMVLFILYFTILSLKNIFLGKYKNNFYFALLFILFWPLQTTGSFTSSMNGFFYFIGFAIFYNSIKNLKFKNND